MRTPNTVLALAFRGGAISGKLAATAISWRTGQADSTSIVSKNLARRSQFGSNFSPSHGRVRARR